MKLVDNLLLGAKQKVSATNKNDIDPTELGLFIKELYAEVDWLAKPSPSNGVLHYPDPIHLSLIERRLLVRTVFAFIEAVMFNLKITAVGSKRADSFSAGEMALAKEEDYELDDSGAVKIRSARIRFLSNFRFAFTVAAKASGSDYKIDVGGTGWQSLRDTVPVRDRLMHPKRVADLAVTDEEIRSLMRAFEWVEKELIIVSLKGLKDARTTRTKLPDK